MQSNKTQRHILCDAIPQGINLTMPYDGCHVRNCILVFSASYSVSLSPGKTSGIRHHTSVWHIRMFSPFILRSDSADHKAPPSHLQVCETLWADLLHLCSCVCIFLFGFEHLSLPLLITTWHSTPLALAVPSFISLLNISDYRDTRDWWGGKYNYKRAAREIPGRYWWVCFTIYNILVWHAEEK